MLNHKIRGVVESTTPFAFSEGEHIKHGITITLKCFTGFDIMDDIAGDFKEAMRILLAGQLPIRGAYSLQLPQMADLVIAYPGILKSTPCELVDVVADTPVGEKALVTLKIKMKELSATAKGNICDTLRTEVDVHFQRLQYQMNFDGPQTDSAVPPPAPETPALPAPKPTKKPKNRKRKEC